MRKLKREKRRRRRTPNFEKASAPMSTRGKSGRLSSTNFAAEGEEPAATAASSAGEKSQPAIWLDAMKRVASSMVEMVEDGICVVWRTLPTLLVPLLRVSRRCQEDSGAG